MYRYIFGPVNSRRLGSSLGIDLFDEKVCSHNCVYCEAKKTQLLTIKRRAFVKAKLINNEIDSFIKNNNINLDYITFSGKGEPTLSSEIRKVIRHIKRYYLYNVCVLTNGSLLHLKSVRRDLLEADLIISSIDAVSDKVFRIINRPYGLLDSKKMFDGIKALRLEFNKELWIEILFVKGINDSKNEIDLLKSKIMEINPNRVYINTIYRPPAFDGYLAIDSSTLEELQFEFDSILGITSKDICTKNTNIFTTTDNLLDKLIPMLRIRPCTLEDIYNIFYLNSSITKDVLKDMLTDLVKNKKLFISNFNSNTFYYCNQKAYTSQ